MISLLTSKTIVHFSKLLMNGNLIKNNPVFLNLEIYRIDFRIFIMPPLLKKVRKNLNKTIKTLSKKNKIKKPLFVRDISMIIYQQMHRLIIFLSLSLQLQRKSNSRIKTFQGLKDLQP